MIRINNDASPFVANVPATKETPSGTKNGTNKVFTIVATPIYFIDVAVISNSGVTTRPAFTMTGVSEVTFTTYAPASTDTLVCWSV